MNKISIGILGLAIIAAMLISGCTAKTSEQDNTVADNNVTMETKSNTMASGSYDIYTPEKVANAEGNVVLFFHASWCPSCRRLNSDIENNLDSIPSDLTILKVDYDKETALKQKYGVTTQHTLVQVDNQGNLVTKWSGGSSLEGLIAEVKTTQSTQPEMTGKETESNKMASGSYDIYTPEKVANAKGKVVLFFHASWCPSCRRLNSDIENNLDSIPSDLTILKVDYDKETALKQKYGVTTQHTLVQVDDQGILVTKWSGGSSLEGLIAEVK
jgi:thioredoxin 1